MYKGAFYCVLLSAIATIARSECFEGLEDCENAPTPAPEPQNLEANPCTNKVENAIQEKDDAFADLMAEFSPGAETTVQTPSVNTCEADSAAQCINADTTQCTADNPSGMDDIVNTLKPAPTPAPPSDAPASDDPTDTTTTTLKPTTIPRTTPPRDPCKLTFSEDEDGYRRIDFDLLKSSDDCFVPPKETVISFIANLTAMNTEAELKTHEMPFWIKQLSKSKRAMFERLLDDLPEIEDLTPAGSWWSKEEREEIADKSKESSKKLQFTDELIDAVNHTGILLRIGKKSIDTFSPLAMRLANQCMNLPRVSDKTKSDCEKKANLFRKHWTSKIAVGMTKNEQQFEAMMVGTESFFQTTEAVFNSLTYSGSQAIKNGHLLMLASNDRERIHAVRALHARTVKIFTSTEQHLFKGNRLSMGFEAFTNNIGKLVIAYGRLTQYMLDMFSQYDSQYQNRDQHLAQQISDGQRNITSLQAAITTAVDDIASREKLQSSELDKIKAMYDEARAEHNKNIKDAKKAYEASKMNLFREQFKIDKARKQRVEKHAIKALQEDNKLQTILDSMVSTEVNKKKLHDEKVQKAEEDQAAKQQGVVNLVAQTRARYTGRVAQLDRQASNQVKELQKKAQEQTRDLQRKVDSGKQAYDRKTKSIQDRIRKEKSENRAEAQRLFKEGRRASEEGDRLSAVNVGSKTSSSGWWIFGSRRSEPIIKDKGRGQRAYGAQVSAAAADLMNTPVGPSSVDNKEVDDASRVVEEARHILYKQAEAARKNDFANIDMEGNRKLKKAREQSARLTNLMEQDYRNLNDQDPAFEATIRKRDVARAELDKLRNVNPISEYHQSSEYKKFNTQLEQKRDQIMRLRNQAERLKTTYTESEMTNKTIKINENMEMFQKYSDVNRPFNADKIGGQYQHSIDQMKAESNRLVEKINLIKENKMELQATAVKRELQKQLNEDDKERWVKRQTGFAKEAEEVKHVQNKLKGEMDEIRHQINDFNLFLSRWIDHFKTTVRTPISETLQSIKEFQLNNHDGKKTRELSYMEVEWTVNLVDQGLITMKTFAKTAFAATGVIADLKAQRKDRKRLLYHSLPQLEAKSTELRAKIWPGKIQQSAKAVFGTAKLNDRAEKEHAAVEESNQEAENIGKPTIPSVTADTQEDVQVTTVPVTTVPVKVPETEQEVAEVITAIFEKFNDTEITTESAVSTMTLLPDLEVNGDIVVSLPEEPVKLDTSGDAEFNDLLNMFETTPVTEIHKETVVATVGGVDKNTDDLMGELDDMMAGFELRRRRR